jgi:hypothetical protein
MILRQGLNFPAASWAPGDLDDVLGLKHRVFFVRAALGDSANASRAITRRRQTEGLHRDAAR